MVLSEQQYLQVLEKMREWVRDLERTGEDTKPLYWYGGEGEAVTPRHLLGEVEARTPFGQKFLESWVDLAMRHILNAPLRETVDVRDRKSVV